eukprot:207459-Prorocentrum_minimum.AAC.1
MTYRARGGGIFLKRGPVVRGEGAYSCSGDLGAPLSVLSGNGDESAVASARYRLASDPLQTPSRPPPDPLHSRAL